MMNYRAVFFLVLLCLAVFSQRLAADATYLVYAPTIQGTLARYPLFVDFTTVADEEMAYFAVDVSASHPDLTFKERISPLSTSARRHPCLTGGSSSGCRLWDRGPQVDSGIRHGFVLLATRKLPIGRTAGRLQWHEPAGR